MDKSYRSAIKQAREDTTFRNKLEQESSRSILMDKDLRRRAMEGNLEALTDVVREWDKATEDLTRSFKSVDSF